MRIGIDIDGTLTNIEKKLFKCAQNYAQSLNKNINNINANDNNSGNKYQSIFNFNYNELKYFLGPLQEKITNKAKPRKNVVNIIKKLHEEGNEIYIITARDKEFHKNPYKQSKEWLDKNLIYYDKLIVNAREKGKICVKNNIDLLIDDNIYNCIDAHKNGIPSLIISNKSNKNQIKTCKNWEQIYNYIHTNIIIKNINEVKMKKIIYLIRHSAPFIEIDNYNDYKNVPWNEYNKNMILSIEGENNAKKLTNIDELKNIDEIYSSNSCRAIQTAKYIAEYNNIKIKLDNRINERELGINTINDLPDNYNKLSFDNKDLKLNNGESLNEVDNRFKSFINELLDSKNNKIVIILHGIIQLSYLQTICDSFNYDGKTFNIKYKNNIILNGTPTNPNIYKITYEDKNIINIENIEC